MHLMVLENKVQILYPMHSLHEKQSKATFNTKEYLFLSLFWICLLKYLFIKHTCSQDHSAYHAVLLVNALIFLLFSFNTWIWQGFDHFSPPHFYFLEKVLSSWGNNDIEEDSMFNQYTIIISTSEQERWKGNNELHTFCLSFTLCWLENMGKKFK